MLQTKRFILLIFSFILSANISADEISNFENPLQYFKKYYTKEQLKEIHKLNMKVLIEIEKKTTYPPKMEREQARIEWMKYAFPFISEASALGVNGRCFFGGWKTEQGPTWCHEPWRYTKPQDIKDFGPTYDSSNYCGGKDLFRCNPVIFGMPKNPKPALGRNPERGICIKISSYRNVTRKCTEEAMKYLDEFIDSLEGDGKALSGFLTHTAEILRYCEVDKLDYCEKLKEYLMMVTKKAEECEKAQIEEAQPGTGLKPTIDAVEEVVERLDPDPVVKDEKEEVVAVVDPDPVVKDEPVKAGPTLEDKIAEYSNSIGAKNMINRMRTIYRKNCSRSSCTGSKANVPTGACWKYVKHGLMSGGFARDYMEEHKVDYPYTRTESAKYAGRDFFETPQVGFTNLLDTDKYKSMSSKDAPVGAVLVYEGGTHGHVEVKGSNSEYMSDFRDQDPIDASNPYRRSTRKLIGVYVKID